MFNIQSFIVISKDITLKLPEETEQKTFMIFVPNVLKNQKPQFDL